MRRLCLAFILLSNFVLGQSAYLDVTSSWHERLTTYPLGQPDTYVVQDYQYHFVGDTIINSKSYYKLFRTGVDTSTNLLTNDYTVSYFNDTVGFIREDTLTSEFYFLRRNYPTNLEEQLYDFTLDQGDTIFPNGGNYGVCANAPINSGSNFVFDGEIRRRVDVGCICDQAARQIFEGIGVGSGLLGSMCASWDGVSTCLLGFSNSNDTIEFSNCSSIVTSVTNTDSSEPLIAISPNPVRSTVQIKVDNDKTDGFQYSVYSILGQPVLTNKTVWGRSETVDMSTLETGVYVILMTVDNTIISRKVLKF